MNKILFRFTWTRTIPLLLFITLLQQCSYSQTSNQKKTTMDSTKKDNNPVYSRTDSSKVTLTDEQ